MSTKPHEIAEAVAAMIRSATLSVPVTAARGWMPEYAVSDLSETEYSVTVVPIGRQSERITRGNKKRRDIEVFVRVDRLAPGDESERDALVDEYASLCDEIQELMWSTKPTLSVDATLVDLVEVVAQTDALDKLNQFTSSLAATYRLFE